MKPSLTQEQLQAIYDADAAVGSWDELQISPSVYTERRLLLEHIRTLVVPAHPPVAMLLWCPSCGNRHIDEGEYATKPHHTHACQHCGMVWRPAVVNTVGVQFLPGFVNTPSEAPELCNPDTARKTVQGVVIRKSCMHCGSVPLATERGACEDCGRYQTSDGKDPSGELE